MTHLDMKGGPAWLRGLLRLASNRMLAKKAEASLTVLSDLGC
jgi:hypothetical protein